MRVTRAYCKYVPKACTSLHTVQHRCSGVCCLLTRSAIPLYLFVFSSCDVGDVCTNLPYHRVSVPLARGYYTVLSGCHVSDSERKSPQRYIQNPIGGTRLDTRSTLCLAVHLRRCTLSFLAETAYTTTRRPIAYPNRQPLFWLKTHSLKPPPTLPPSLQQKRSIYISRKRSLKWEQTDRLHGFARINGLQRPRLSTIAEESCRQ